jgi:hypothetical protein
MFQNYWHIKLYDILINHMHIRAIYSKSPKIEEHMQAKIRNSLPVIYFNKSNHYQQLFLPMCLDSFKSTK